MSILPAGCGFQLRGSVDLPEQWRRVHLAAASPNSELGRAVREGLTRNHVSLGGREEANFSLRLGEEEFERRNLTIAGNARALEFELILSTTVQVRDRTGAELLPPTRLSATRVMLHDPENVSGKEEEVRILRADMRGDLARQVLRQVRLLSSRAAGGEPR